MKFIDIFEYALRDLKHRKLRSALTMVGIIIGVLTILIIVSVGDFVKKDITDQLAMFGSDKMIVMPMDINSMGGSSAFTTGVPQSTGKLYGRDAEKISKIAGVESIAKIIYGKSNIGYKDQIVGSMVFGTDASMFEQWNNYLEVEEGRAFTENEQNVVVLGNDAASEMFKDKVIKVGSTIEINGENFRVIGILKKIGTSLSQEGDSAIYIPFKKAQEMFSKTLAKDEISFIYVRIDESYGAENIKEQIESELVVSHKVSLEEKDFSVVTADMIKSTVDAVMGILSAFLLVIGGIASVVSGIGITNTMFMSVTEKTREIGMLKSIGAKSKDIMLIFLLQSAIIGGIGGLLGISGGLVVSGVLNGFEIALIISKELIVGTLIFAMVVGAAAGYLPAKRAANLSPLEALRY